MIELNNVSKVFELPHEKSRTIFEKIISLFKTNLSYENFNALSEINLKINDGECIGIVGNNGSGKSTILKLISKIILPSKGTVLVKGRTAAFIELGVGFQNELTAKENVYLYGTIMGMSRKYISKKYLEIVKFANVKKFMDTKMKSFSSGMRLRLAFATAIQTNPDILILDEVMAIGDQDFQKKSYELFQKYKKNKKTIILATHDLNLVKSCNKVLYLNKGKQIMFDTPNKVLKRYLNDITRVSK